MRHGFRYKKVENIIDAQISNIAKDRADFEAHFNSSQSGFYNHLKEIFPKLTANDLRLCSLVKMGFSSKEIANYLNLAPHSVEISRYRLRKKLDLNSEKNLMSFLMNLD